MKIKEFLQEKNGKYSSKRLGMIIVYFTFSISYILSVVKSGGTFQDLGLYWALLLSAMLGISVLFGKMEKNKEQKSE